jgi:diaminohydroxyphosphoribosylaminopyrimidine deaminase / 5-amino-6-(5-phosphoribosylamino)uracil reductase
MNATAEKALIDLTSSQADYLSLPARQRPWITLSFGMSLDGKIATYTGDSKYISGPEARRFVHELRDRHAAILVGIETVLIDHPLLTTRLPQGQTRQPLRIILDSKLRLPLTEPIVSQGTLVVTKTNVDVTKIQALKNLGVTVLIDPSPQATIDLTWLLAHLKAQAIDSILVEGGGTVHESFIKQQYFNLLVAQVSPILIGGKDAKTPVEGQGFARLMDATRVAFHTHFPLGRDIILLATLLSPQKEQHA